MGGWWRDLSGREARFKNVTCQRRARASERGTVVELAIEDERSVRGAGAYPLTRERVERLQEVEKKRRQASIEKGHRSPSLLPSYHESQEMALCSLL
jgi:hypothetical protein